MKVGMIGAGGIAQPHLRAWKHLGVPVNVYSQAGAPELTNMVDYGNVAANLETLFENCDTVDIATPTDTHAGLIRSALNAGKNVISEKPLAMSSAEAQELLELANQKGKHLYVGHVVRYFPAYAKALQAVKDGGVGEVAVARFERTGAFPAWASWFADPRRSGGVILDLAVHDLDMAVAICGPVKTVFATLERRSGFELTQITLTHESGALSYVKAGWLSPDTPFTTSFDIAGTEGTLRYSSAEDTTFTLDGKVSAPGIPEADASVSPYTQELGSFADAIGGGAQPRVLTEDAVEAIRLAEAAARSARTGQPVQLVEQDQDEDWGDQ